MSVEYVDPRTLLVDANVRLDSRSDADLIASIRDLGVLQPIITVRTADGGRRVRLGHRRTAAAIEAGRATVPTITAADEGTDDAAQVERLMTQWAENEHRAGLNTAERVGVIAQLAAFGVSAAKIAKRTRVKRAEVDAALTVAGSDLARAAAVRYGDFLDLVQAATVAEFEDDTEAVKTLVAAAKAGQFAHVAQRLRDARAEAQHRADIEAGLREAGVTVIERPSYNGTAKNLDDLRTADGEALTAGNHAACPGHGAYVATLHGYVDPATGAPVDEASIDDEDYEDDEDYDEHQADDVDADPDDQGDVEAEAADATARVQDPSGAEEQPGAARPVWTSYLGARYVCVDPKAHGHVDRYAGYGGHDSGSGRKPVAQMSDAEREAARAERRDVIDSNKAWTSAETVRQQWLTTFLTRKSAPKGTGAFVAATLTSDASLVADHKAAELTNELLGLPHHSGWGHDPVLLTAIEEASDARAQVVALARVIAGCEAATGKHSWRTVNRATARYLRFLAAQGYALAPVERRACGEVESAVEAEQPDA